MDQGTGPFGSRLHENGGRSGSPRQRTGAQLASLSLLLVVPALAGVPKETRALITCYSWYRRQTAGFTVVARPLDTQVPRAHCDRRCLSPCPLEATATGLGDWWAVAAAITRECVGNAARTGLPVPASGETQSPFPADAVCATHTLVCWAETENLVLPGAKGPRLRLNTLRRQQRTLCRRWRGL